MPRNGCFDCNKKGRLFHVTIWICRWRMNTLVTSQYQPR